MNKKKKKPFYKSWLFYVILIIAIYNIPNDEDTVEPANSETIGQSTVVPENPSNSVTFRNDSAQVQSETTINPYADLLAIARKSESEIEQILGSPIHSKEFDFEMGGRVFKTYPVKLNYYTEMLEEEMGRVEIMFVEGAAHRLRINLLDQEYDRENRANALQYAGLPWIEFEPPKSKIQASSFAQNTNGLFQIVVSDWIGTDYGSVQIITEEKYK